MTAQRFLMVKRGAKIVAPLKVLFCLFQSQCLGGLVAYGARTPVLDWTRIYITGILCPLVAVGSKLLEWFAIQFNKSLADHWFHLTVTALHVHHHGDRHTTGNPRCSRSCGILNDGHVTGLAAGDKLCSTCTQCIAVVCIEVGWSSATSFVTEEVMLCSKLTYKRNLGLHRGEVHLTHVAQQFLCLDE